MTPLPPGADTTSHDWVFDPPILLGVNPSSLSDVVIVNDTLAYIAGEVYQNDSTGMWDPNPYNLVKWTPKGVEVRRVPFYFPGDTTLAPSALPTRAIFAFGPEDIWLAGNSEVTHLAGNRQLGIMNIPVSTERLWGTSSSNLYAVGAIGRIAHHDGHAWTQMASGTSRGLTDVRGGSDGSDLWACGFSHTEIASILLRCRGGQWTQVWAAQPGGVAPYGSMVLSVWVGSRYLYAAAGDGIYRTPRDGSGEAEKVLPLGWSPRQIRGTAENNIAVSTDDAAIWHYNGASWKQLVPGAIGMPMVGLAITDHLLIAVGYDATTTEGWKARFVVGRRQ